EVWTLSDHISERHKCDGLNLTTVTRSVVSRDKNYLAAFHQTGKLEVWDLKTGTARTLVSENDSLTQQDVIQDRLTVSCLCEYAAFGRLRLYDWTSGKLLAELTNVPQPKVIHYDASGRRVYVWTSRGDCVMYTERRRVFRRFRLWRTGRD